MELATRATLPQHESCRRRTAALFNTAQGTVHPRIDVFSGFWSLCKSLSNHFFLNLPGVTPYFFLKDRVKYDRFSKPHAEAMSRIFVSAAWSIRAAISRRKSLR